MTIDTIEYLGTDKPINNSKPLVSICITTYQHAEYIEQCIQGALAQRCDHPYEILLGDDDSVDGTREICMRYAEQHPDKIRLFLHDKSSNYLIAGGRTGKNNFVHNLKNARGEYLAFCDGDDYWTSPDKIRLQVQSLEQHTDSAICFHKVSTIDENSGAHGHAGDFGDHADTISAENIIRKLGGAIPLNSMMIRNSLTHHIIQYSHEVSGMHFFIQALGSTLSPGGVAYLPIPMGCYRKNTRSSVTNNLFNTRQGKYAATVRNLKMLDIIHKVSAGNSSVPLAAIKKKIVMRAIASGLIETKDIPSLCTKAGTSWYRFATVKSVIKALRNRFKHTLGV